MPSTIPSQRNRRSAHYRTKRQGGLPFPPVLLTSLRRICLGRRCSMFPYPCVFLRLAVPRMHPISTGMRQERPSPSSRPSRTCAAWLLLTALTLAGSAQAACTDPAAPAVNWRRCYMDGRDLKSAPLEGAMLREATFQRSDLTAARLAQADAYRAKFLSARMDGVVLDGARLIEADLTRAEMTGASLKEADLRNAKLVGAIMKGADLTGARLEGADLRNADLSGARWTDGRICGDASLGQCH